ncbi:PREDICTED: importin-5-like [Lupinus angustifolius]|uniref:importin-5-like n=1 Tax=Lupinus angustifolius TaxID=3871 RepID=UPI00092EA286|nr:PREDICTED: importin-5-like [Lupinus angustifolius]
MEASSDSESIEFSTELQSQTQTILSSNDNSPMETLFSHFFNTNNNYSSQQHSHSLTFFQCCKKHHPDLLFIKLFFLLRCSPTATTRANAARVILFLKPSHLWPKLKPMAQAHLKAHLIQYLKEETTLHVIRLASLVTAETVSAIYNSNNRHQQQWPEVFSFILSSLASKDDRFLEVALLILSALPKRCRLMLSDHNRSLHGYLLTTLCSTNPDVKTASFSTVVSLVCLFYDPSMFHELLRAMMVGVFALLHGYECSYFRKAFKELINLVSQEPSMLKPYMSDMVLDVLQIAESSGLSKGTHCLAFELVMEMAGMKECESVLVKLDYNVTVRVFMVLMNMLMCVEEDKKRDSEEVKGEESEVDVYKFGMKCLNQLCVTLGGSKVVPVAHHLLQICMDSPEWKMRHAGITMLAVIAKQFSDEMVFSENFLSEVVTKVLKSFEDSHVQVRLAAFNFMETPSNFVQVAHILYHHRLVHAFAIAIDNGHDDKVKEQAASAMLFFLKNTLPESLTLYKNTDTLMTKLLSLLQGKESAKQRSLALSAFNIVSQQCHEIGHRQYANYLPILLEACNDKNSEIKEEAIRGIRICAQFGTPQFKPFVNRILSELSILIQAPNARNAKEYDIAVSALGRICEFHRDSIDGSRIVPFWLSLLPLKDDLIEAKVMHEQLCLMVSRLDKDLLGAGNQNLLKIIEVFLEVIDKGDKLASPQTVKQIHNLLRQFGRIIPRSALDTILLSLNAQQRELLLPSVSS